MNPKPQRKPWGKKILVCPDCSTEFIADGRGKRIFCKQCQTRKKQEHSRLYAQKKKKECYEKVKQKLRERYVRTSQKQNEVQK